MTIPVLHALTTDGVLLGPTFRDDAERVMRATGLRGALHLRGGRIAARELFEIALALMPVSVSTGCRLIINDRADIALATGAWGTQLTSRSVSVAALRRLRPDHPIGASVHLPPEAAAAASDAASWIVVGHVFETASHPSEAGRGLAFLTSAVAAAAGVPVIAIGGLTPERVAAVRRAGAHGLAVIRGIWDASDAGAAATDYLTAHDHAGDDASHGHDHGEWRAARDSRG